MIYNDLIAQIQKESRVSGDSGFLPVIVGLFNELFKEAVESQRPFELRGETQITLTTDQELVPLPADFFIHHQIFFFDADTQKKYQLIDQDKAAMPAPRGLYGHPKTYEVMSPNIGIKPFDAVVGGDAIFLVYYKNPPVVTLDNLIAANPIPRLEPFLIRACIRRLRLLHSDDVQVAQLLTGDITSAASGYAKDKPEKERA